MRVMGLHHRDYISRVMVKRDWMGFCVVRSGRVRGVRRGRGGGGSALGGWVGEGRSG